MGQKLNSSSGNSRVVESSQRGVHPGLAARVRRQSASRWRKPTQAVDRLALEAIDAAIRSHAGPVFLDSFCGTGLSTVHLAEENPEALVIGIDQSARRLSRHAAKPGNCLLLRAHCEAVWRHLADRGMRLSRHTIFYPNPWPKPGQLGRRIHGHPAFHLLPVLGGRLELRSNWPIYVEEFGFALQLLEHSASVAVVGNDEEPVTLFERKYRNSGHTLWRLRANLG